MVFKEQFLRTEQCFQQELSHRIRSIKGKSAHCQPASQAAARLTWNSRTSPDCVAHHVPAKDTRQEDFMSSESP